MPATRQDPRPAPLAKAVAGGALMGMANLVPGVSGGTMLLAAGVYVQCVEAIAKLTRFRFESRSILLLVAIGGSAILVIASLAGPVKGLVLDYRWAMYSLFLGSTLGGVPVLWQMIGRPGAQHWIGAAVGLGAMVVAAAVPEGSTAAGSPSAPLLFLGGLGAFAAMMLPGLSGGYVLLISGQYLVVLGAIERLQAGIAGIGTSGALALAEPLRVLVPFGLGGLVALPSASNLIGYLLRRKRALTLGFLLGLVAGAVTGLWPFRDAGHGLTSPSVLQAAAALGLAVAGFSATVAIARIGSRREAG